MDCLHTTQLIIDICRRNHSSTYSEQQWSKAVPYLHEHRLLGLAYSNWKHKMPENIQTGARRQYQRQLHYSSLLKSELQRFSPEDFTLLKGPSLLDYIYSDWGVRSISDIDILVAPKKVPDIENQLEAEGYKAAKKNRWSQTPHKQTFHKQTFGTEITIEVHTKLFASEPNSSQYWRRDTKDNRLALEDLFIHLVGHLTHQHTYIKLFWLVDIDLLLQKFGDQMDWIEVGKKVEDLKIKNSFDSCCWALTHLFENSLCLPSLSNSWKRSLRWKNLITMERNSIQYQWLKHKLKDSWGEALIYDLKWARQRVLPSRLS